MAEARSTLVVVRHHDGRHNAANTRATPSSVEPAIPDDEHQTGAKAGGGSLSHTHDGTRRQSAARCFPHPRVGGTASCLVRRASRPAPRGALQRAPRSPRSAATIPEARPRAAPIPRRHRTGQIRSDPVRTSSISRAQTARLGPRTMARRWRRRSRGPPVAERRTGTLIIVAGLNSSTPTSASTTCSGTSTTCASCWPPATQ